MKILVVTSQYNRYLFERLCEDVEGEKIFCKYEEALEKLLAEEPTHVLLDFDGAILEGGDEYDEYEYAQNIWRDLRQSASTGQKVLATSYMRLVDIGGGLEAEHFLRKPYTPKGLATKIGVG